MTTAKNYTVLHTSDDVASPIERQVRSIDAKINRAKRPDEILNESVQALGSGSLHCDLAPAVAADRWGKVLDAYAACEELANRWNDLEAEAEAVRANAVKKGAEAIRTGKKAPSLAAAILDAETALESCSLVLTESVADLRKTRSAYDALWSDRKFLTAYRDAVIADFKNQRAKAAKAYSVFAGAVGETRRRYATLHDLTANDLEAIPDESYRYLPLRGAGWAHAGLSTSLDVLHRQVSETDLLLSGDFLAMPLDEIADKAEELAEERMGPGENEWAVTGWTRS